MTAGTLVIEALSLAVAAALRFGAALLYSRVPLEASDLESSTIAAVRWRGGAMAGTAGVGRRKSRTNAVNGYRD